MDAAEDRDLKLQRASTDLVTEFSAKLPQLLWKAQNATLLRTPRKWAQVTKTERLVKLVRTVLDSEIHGQIRRSSANGHNSSSLSKNGLSSWTRICSSFCLR